MVIISRCPYRVSLLGGSSDLDWYVNQNGEGLSIGFAIKLYSRVVAADRKSNGFGILNYSSREEYNAIDSISHPIIRATLKRLNINKMLELSSIGDTLSGSGLGSSSSFSIALIKSIVVLQNLEMSNNEIAHIASEIELTDLNKPIGRQDQYLCALGGVNVLYFKPNGLVNNRNDLKLSEAIENFSKNLYLINSKIRRNASKKLENIKNDKNSKIHIDELLNIAKIFLDKSKNLNKSEIEEFLEISMKKAWDIKRNMNSVMNLELINIEKTILKKGFSLLKLLGAGGGGYFLVSYKGNNIDREKDFFESIGLELIKIELSHEGCSACIF